METSKLIIYFSIRELESISHHGLGLIMMQSLRKLAVGVFVIEIFVIIIIYKRFVILMSLHVILMRRDSVCDILGIPLIEEEKKEALHKHCS